MREGLMGLKDLYMAQHGGYSGITIRAALQRSLDRFVWVSRVKDPLETRETQTNRYLIKKPKERAVGQSHVS
jgi:hypothetical protein